MKTKKILFLFLFLLGLGVLAGLPFQAKAGYFKTADGPWLRHSEAVEENFYLAGPNVSTKGSVEGDLIVAGGNITSQGSTTEDVMIAGGTLNLDGPIGGDARLAGGTINVSDSVGGDLLVFGGNIFVGPDLQVGSDVMIAGGQISFEGKAQDQVQISGGEVFLDAQIEKDVKIKASNLELGPETQIQGDLAYSSPQEADISAEAGIEGEIDYTETKTPGASGIGVFDNAKNFLKTLKVANLVLSLISALVVVFIFSNFSKKLAKRGISKLGKNVLLGFATLVLVPIAAVVLFASLIGSMFGFLALTLYLSLIILAQIVTGIIVGALLSTFMNEKAVVDWQWTVGGVFLVWLLGLLPIVGWFITLLFFLLALGTLVSLSYQMVLKSEES